MLEEIGIWLKNCWIDDLGVAWSPDDYLYSATKGTTKQETLRPCRGFKGPLRFHQV
jgi:hypothetical protein